MCSVDVVRTLVVAAGMHSVEMEETKCLERAKSLVVVVVIDHSTLEQHLAKVHLMVQAGMTSVAHC